MLLAGALFVCWPLYRHRQRLTPGLALGAIGVLSLSAILYTAIGSPGTPSGPAGPGALPSIDDMVTSLSERLEKNPEDVEGWKMLGRSYVQMSRFDDAIAAFEQALARGSSTDAEALADLAEAVIMKQEGSTEGRAGDLVESALAAAPGNSKALFYGGMAAIQRNDPSLAADRWEALLSLAPPEEIRPVLQQRIAEWRGAAGGAPPARVSVNVTLSEAARASLDDSVTVFIIARDPSRPGPPVAAERRKAGELPATIELTDADAMIPGRGLSQFPRLEIVARASLSGQPAEQPGDWFGSAAIDVGPNSTVDVEIGERVQ